MLLWDAESRSWAELISRLPGPARRRLALDIIEVCFESFHPSFEQSFSSTTVARAREALALFRRQINEESLGVPEDEFINDLYDLQDLDPTPGVASIVMTISEYADAIQRELSEDDVLTIMSGCYEAILNREEIPRVTVQAEGDNDNCVRLISRQKALLEEAVARSSLPVPSESKYAASTLEPIQEDLE